MSVAAWPTGARSLVDSLAMLLRSHCTVLRSTSIHSSLRPDSTVRRKVNATLDANHPFKKQREMGLIYVAARLLRPSTTSALETHGVCICRCVWYGQHFKQLQALLVLAGGRTLNDLHPNAWLS